jgi:type I restriction enzyme S subunit
VSSGWPIRTLDEVLLRTETVNPAAKPGTEFEYVDVSAVSNETFEITETQRLKGKDAPSRARRMIRAEDVLFATVRPTLQRIAIVPSELDGQVCSTGYFVMRPKPGLDHRWLFYSLFTEDFTDQMQALQKGASYPAVNDSDVRAQRIPLPPVPEQQRIVRILDEAFAAIATAKANTEQNLANARAVFERSLQTVFTRQTAGWVNRPLIEVCTLVNGRAYKKDELLDNGKYPVLRVGNFFTNNNWYHSDLELEQDKYCDHGDLLYAWSASFGPRIWHGGKVIYHYHIWKVIPNTARVEKRFLYHLLAWDVDEIKRAHGTGTTMMHVSKGSMEGRVVPVPPLDAQSRIAQSLDALTAETQRLESLAQQKLAALDALKKSLLHHAFTGQLTGALV